MRHTVLAVAAIALGAQVWAQTGPEVVATVDGDPVYQVLPVGAIPAIDVPDFVSGETADAQMLVDEPVIGVVVDGKARAYSMWQLDNHEIVNDTVAGVPIAVTW